MAENISVLAISLDDWMIGNKILPFLALCIDKGTNHGFSSMHEVPCLS